MSVKSTIETIHVTSLAQWQDDEQAFLFAGELYFLCRQAGLTPENYPAVLDGAHVFFQFWASVQGLCSWHNPYCESFANIPLLIDFVAGFAPVTWVTALRQVQLAATGLDDRAEFPSSDDADWDRFMPPVIVTPISDTPYDVLKQAAAYLRAQCPVAVVAREDQTTVAFLARR